MKPTFRALISALLVAAAACAPSGDEPLPETAAVAVADAHAMHPATDAPGALATDAAGIDPAKPLVRVWKSPTCGCCGAWVELVRAAGYPVEVIDVSDVAPVKQEQGVPARLASCHTATVDGYVVEGHVPLDAMARMLAERPEIAGIAVPGMPTGAPGMEVPGVPADAFDVVAFEADGSTRVYDRR